MKNETTKRETLTPGELEAARELVLYGLHNGDLYEMQAWPIVRNLARRVVRGEYDHGRAVTLWAYYADTAARQYTREHDNPAGRPFGAFPPRVRREAARKWAGHYAESVAFEAAQKIGPARVVVTVGDYGRDINGNRTARVWVDGVSAGSRRVQTGSGPDMGTAWHAALARAGYLPRWYTVANVEGHPGGFSSATDPFTITLHRAPIVVGPWITPAGDPSY